MATSSDFSVGLVHEFILTACKAGFEAVDLSALTQSESKLRQVLAFTRGHAEITTVTHLIDLDADPFVPEGWRVVEHKQGGQFVWDPSLIKLYLSPKQMGDKRIEGNKLRKELEQQPIFNANLGDYLLAHPHLIPEEWKKDENGNIRYIFFWATIYRDADGYLYVRYLFWYGGRWEWGSLRLAYDFSSDDPAAVRASSELETK